MQLDMSTLLIVGFGIGVMFLFGWVHAWAAGRYYERRAAQQRQREIAALIDDKHLATSHWPQ